MFFRDRDASFGRLQLSRRLWPALVCLALAFFWSASASAWIETIVRSHQARVSVAADGQAEIRHELVLKVRGGPLKSLEIPGIGDDIEALPDASVRRAMRGSGSVWPLELATTEDGGLRLRIVSDRGVRGGTYRFEFAYKQDLTAQGWLKQVDGGTELTWVGPRLSTGVDSAKMLFIVPRGQAEPRLPETDGGAAGRVLLGQVRRAGDTDEVELVRAHLATGEPAVWKIVVDGSAIGAPGLPEQAVSPQLPVVRRALSHAGRSPFQWGFLAGLTLLFGALVFFKSRLAIQAAARVDARVRPLLPGGPVVRALIAASGAAAASWFAFEQQPTPLVVCAAVVMAAGTHLLPVRVVRPRGPASWSELVSGAGEQERLPGRMFESASPQGFLLLTVLLLLPLWGAYVLLPQSHFLALMVLLVPVVALPLFWTGRHADLPEGPAAQVERWFRYLKKAVPDEQAAVELWGRRATPVDGGTPAPVDEARVRLALRKVPTGLRALEVAFDEGAGAHVLPCVVVRALVDSPAIDLLPKDIPWQRGRRSDERVAILRPATPARGQLLRLLRSLMTSLAQRPSAGSGADLQASSSASRSAGSSSERSNLSPSAAVPAM